MPTKTPAPAAEKEYEQWENTTASRVCLMFYNIQGALEDKIIDGHRKFQITPKERQLNQERAADDSLDHFRNGMLAPVRLIESADDVEQIRSNPNLVTEDEMKALIGDRKDAKAFQARLDLITNPYALVRMLELANEDDSATAKQVKAIESRLKNVSPSAFSEIQAFPGAVTTRDLG